MTIDAIGLGRLRDGSFSDSYRIWFLSMIKMDCDRLIGKGGFVVMVVEDLRAYNYVSAHHEQERGDFLSMNS